MSAGLQNARRCGAKARTGLPCRRWAMKNGRCDMHGGKSTGPKKPNRNVPGETRLYARHLQAEQLQAFEDADIDSLDLEVRIAKANADWAVKKWQEDPDGGITAKRARGVDSDSVEVLPYFELVRMHLDNVRKLVEARAALIRQRGGNPDDDPEDYQAWLASTRQAVDRARDEAGN